MDELPGSFHPAARDLERLLEDTRKRLAEMREIVERSQAMVERMVERLDRSEERSASLQARRLSHIVTPSVERDRILLHIPDDDVLERTMAREIDRRVAEGWTISGITYDPREAGRVEIGFQRIATPGEPEPPPVD